MIIKLMERGSYKIKYEKISQIYIAKLEK